jgi:DNA-binding transcriptional LysR family regulator
MSRHAYKQVTTQQLRSFCETARRGSLTAAATALGLAQPTVWKQVHALETAYGIRLIEPHARGCRLTEAGRLLLQLSFPCLANLDTLGTRFGDALRAAEIPITVASSPRFLGEDLVPCVAEFVRTWPHVRFTFREMQVDEVAAAIDAGQADIGFTPVGEGQRTLYPLLTFEPCYHLDVLLIAPRNHPLARRKRVRLEDLRPYPLLSSQRVIMELPGHGVLEDLGFDRSKPRWIEARQASVIRRCVELGLGIALLLGLSGRVRHPEVHERPMTQYFGHSTVYLVRRGGIHQHPAVAEFAATVRRLLGGKKGAAGKTRR